MAITVTCGQCQAEFRANDEQAGKRGNCPRCNGPIEVPSRPTASASNPASKAAGSVVATHRPTSREELEAEILAAFSGQVEPVHVSWTYRLAILLLTLVMVLLPLVYLALIVLVVYGMYYHAINDWGILSVPCAVQIYVMLLLIYLAPLVVGAILVFFMFKPLLARPEKVDRRRSLSRRGEPLLFAFVERICELVGAPAPRRIDVNCELNASASFRRGWLSLVTPADLVVTIGMPLASGLSVRQFACVLTHEFGHFTQGAGMRLTYIIRSISWWLTRVVYERDAWDARLEYSVENSNWRIAIILLLARLCVQLTRRVLWVLMIAGHGVAGFMLRQMEFDADRVAARLAGSETWEATCRRLAVLGVAAKGAFADLGDFYREGRLGDNLPKLILTNVAQTPKESRAKINGAIDQSKTHWLDTHPADSARIASARRENSVGVFQYEAPAAVLFSDFDALARNVTWDFYRGILRAPSLKPSDLHPVDDLLARQGGDFESRSARNRFFQGATFLLRPLPVAVRYLEAPPSAEQTVRDMKLARNQMLAAKSAFDKAFRAFAEADTLALEAQQAAALLKAGFPFDPGAFSQPMPDAAAAEALRAQAVAQQQILDPELTAFEQAAARRLVAALQLLHAPQLAAKLENVEASRRQAARLLPAIALFNHQSSVLIDLRNVRSALAALWNHRKGRGQDPKWMAGIRRNNGLLADRLVRLRSAMTNDGYPFEHARGGMTIGDYLIPELRRDDLGSLIMASGVLLERWPIFYTRSLSNLAMLAELVETACGLEPLPEPLKADL